jgi:hypothetical protein
LAQLPDDTTPSSTLGSGHHGHAHGHGQTEKKQHGAAAIGGMVSSSVIASSLGGGSGVIAQPLPLPLSILNDEWLPNVGHKPSFTKNGYSDVEWSLATPFTNSSSYSSHSLTHIDDVYDEPYADD